MTTKRKRFWQNGGRRSVSALVIGLLVSFNGLIVYNMLEHRKNARAEFERQLHSACSQELHSHALLELAIARLAGGSKKMHVAVDEKLTKDCAEFIKGWDKKLRHIHEAAENISREAKR